MAIFATPYMIPENLRNAKLKSRGIRVTIFYDGEFLKSETPQSETRPHSSPDLSCGREISRGKANPFPQTDCFALPRPH